MFAYGQTGTGKTFTMGTNNTAAAALHTSAGIIPRAIKQIFEKDNASNIKVSFYEILNEQVIDKAEPLILTCRGEDLKLFPSDPAPDPTFIRNEIKICIYILFR